MDAQTIDVSNDHLCYVVTETLTPFHLPLSTSFLLTSKYIITHVAKSKSRLAVFHKILWKERAGLAWSRRLIEKAAFADLQRDAMDLLTVATDEVAKLGAKSASKTNKAVSIFGQVGQATESATVEVKDLPPLPAPPSPTDRPSAPRLRKRGLPSLYRDAALAQLLGLLTFVLDLVDARVKRIGSVASAHVFLIALLALSAAYNTWHGYRDGVGWYHERAAGKFMARLGVRSDPGIARSVWLRDVEELVTPSVGAWSGANTTSVEWAARRENTCAGTFNEVVLATEEEDWSGGEEGKMSQKRLWRTRHSLARYRHDLLVALRVVNRVEEEVVKSEWENWVREESRKCARVQGMLREREEKGESVVLGEAFEEYCGSCKEDLRGLVAK